MNKCCLLLLIAILPTSVVQAQPPQPGTEHEFLAEMQGDWDVVVDAEGASMKGTSSYKMAHGGLWLTSSLEMDMGGMKFSGQGLDSYDPMRKKFVGIWVDSMTTSPLVLEGERSKDGKKLTMTGKGPDSTSGKVVDYKTESEFISKDKHIFKMWMGSTTGDPSMKATYSRKSTK